jgi:hypothetical protein
MSSPCPNAVIAMAKDPLVRRTPAAVVAFFTDKRIFF